MADDIQAYIGEEAYIQMPCERSTLPRTLWAYVLDE